MNSRDSRAYDLSRVLQKLNAKLYPSFVRAVRTFHAACSVELDLKAVRHSVDELVALNEAPTSAETSRRGQALMVHAVVTYARATHSDAITRYKVGVTGAYDKALLASHKQIIALRDKCFAHFGPGDDLWHDERVVYVKTEQGNGVTMAHSRTNYKQDTIDMLEALTEAAIPYLKNLQRKRADDLNKELMELPKELNSAINGDPFDPGEFFGIDAEACKRFWEENGFFETFAKSAPQP